MEDDRLERRAARAPLGLDEAHVEQRTAVERAAIVRLLHDDDHKAPATQEFGHVLQECVELRTAVLLLLFAERDDDGKER